MLMEEACNNVVRTDNFISVSVRFRWWRDDEEARAVRVRSAGIHCSRKKRERVRKRKRRVESATHESNDKRL